MDGGHSKAGCVTEVYGGVKVTKRLPTDEADRAQIHPPGLTHRRSGIERNAALDTV